MSQQEVNEKARQAVLTYKADDAKAAAQQAIDEGLDLVDVINNGFTAGITEVGDLFDKKKIFLPHIMAAAAAMNAGVDLLTPIIEESGASTGPKLGSFMICSIEGDIHSIGKDICAILLKVAGFEVHNIGRDVLVKDIVEKCKELKPDVVGTSALMTSTMVNQKTLEEALKAAGLRNEVITNIGGAPTSQEWADEIGADTYSENANDCVAATRAALER